MDLEKNMVVRKEYETPSVSFLSADELDDVAIPSHLIITSCTSATIAVHLGKWPSVGIIIFIRNYVPLIGIS